MGQLRTIPTKAAVDQAWQRYSALSLAIQADPETRADPAMLNALGRAHDRFVALYDEWSGR
jgi:hypothetical protein